MAVPIRIWSMSSLPSILEDRTPFPSDIDAAYWTGVGLLAHESAMEGGTVKSLPKYEEL